MLISYRHKFIFIHVYKVAGTSVSVALNDYCLNNPIPCTGINKLIEPFVTGRRLSNRFSNIVQRALSGNLTGKEIHLPFIPTFLGHYTSSEIKKRVPEKIWNNFFKFGFVRNPWDWQVSLYHYMLSHKTHFQHNLVKKMGNFETYIEWRGSEDKHLQKEFFYDQKCKLLVDYIGKFENLEQDFRSICNIIGIPDIELPHIGKSKHDNYRKYYNDYTRDLIAKHFEEDIKLFSYTF